MWKSFLQEHTLLIHYNFLCLVITLIRARTWWRLPFAPKEAMVWSFTFRKRYLNVCFLWKNTHLPGPISIIQCLCWPWDAHTVLFSAMSSLSCLYPHIQTTEVGSILSIKHGKRWGKRQFLFLYLNCTRSHKEIRGSSGELWKFPHQNNKAKCELLLILPAPDPQVLGLNQEFMLFCWLLLKIPDKLQPFGHASFLANPKRKGLKSSPPPLPQRHLSHPMHQDNFHSGKISTLPSLSHLHHS